MINFKKKDTKTILKEMVYESWKRNLLSEYERFNELIEAGEDIENFHVLHLTVLSNVFEELYGVIEQVNNSININKSNGLDLDNIGKLLGIKRPPATYAYVTILISLENPVSSSKIIPKGSKIQTIEGITYSLAENIQINPNELVVEAGAYAVKAGSNQRVSANTLTIQVTDFSSITGVNTSVNNPRSSTGGSYEATDDEYREYLLNAYKIHEKGTEYSFKHFFAGFDGLDSYKLVPCYNGTGTIKIITYPATSDFHRKLNEELKNVVLYDDGYVLSTPEQRVINLYINADVNIDNLNPYNEEDKQNIATKIKEAAFIFINGGYRRNGEFYKGLGIGEDFIPHKLSVFIDKEVKEVKNLIIKEPANYVSINDEEIITLNNIEVEVV